MSDVRGSENSAETDEFLRYAKKLGEPRRQLLKAFLASDMTVVNTAELRDATKETVSGDSVLHHLERLDSWGFVEEQPEREYHGRGGRDARAWTLTERGRAFCDEYVDAPLDAFVSPEDVADLTQRVEHLEEEVAMREERLESLGRMLQWIIERSDQFTDDEKETILNGV